jgi:D-sedoheptulose 7-phosphate isomerase
MQNKISNSIKLLENLKNDKKFLGSIALVVKTITKSIQSGGTIYICGNGGSATQASHMVGEFVGRFGFDRPALPAISLFDWW